MQDSIISWIVGFFLNIDFMSLLVHKCIVELGVTLTKTKDDVLTRQLDRPTPTIGDQYTTGKS